MATPSAVARTERPAPPLDLTEAESDVWVEVVDSLPADWWSGANLPLLAQYCRHVVGARRVAMLIDQAYAAAGGDDAPVLDLDRLAKLTAMQAQHSARLKALAASMRLAQQSSYSARGAAGAKAKPAATVDRPWTS